jgi:hypothetical protein
MVTEQKVFDGLFTDLSPRVQDNQDPSVYHWASAEYIKITDKTDLQNEDIKLLDLASESDINDHSVDAPLDWWNQQYVDQPVILFGFSPRDIPVYIPEIIIPQPA